MRSEKLASTETRTRRPAGSNRAVQGLEPEHLLFSGEDQEQFEAFRAALLAEFNPQVAPERELLDRVLGHFWRNRRASLFESAVIAAYRAERGQLDPHYAARYCRALNEITEPNFAAWVDQHRPQYKAQIFAVRDEPPPQPSEPVREEGLSKPDFSFVKEAAFLDTICKWASYEGQLTQALSRSLRSLLQSRSNSKWGNNYETDKLVELTSDRIVIAGEDIRALQQLRADLEQQLGPRTVIERELVELIVGLNWRLRRVSVFEVAYIASVRAESKPRKPDFKRWAIEGPDNPLLRFPEYRDGQLVDPTPEEIEAEWQKISARQREIEAKIKEMLGETSEEVLTDLWVVRERKAQLGFSKLGRYEAMLTRQLDRIQALLRFVQACRQKAGERHRDRKRASGPK